MSNREALRDLQARLADRLQTVKAEGLLVSWLAVRVGGRDCLLPLAQSGEIFPLPAVQPVPYTQSWFLGVANLRGAIVGVIDLPHFLLTQALSRNEAYWAQASVVTLNAALDVNACLLVDSLAGLRHVSSFVSSTEPDSNAPSYLGHTYLDPDGRQWQEINLQKLSQHADFLNIQFQGTGL
jgi:twitching motility protein PilI